MWFFLAKLFFGHLKVFGWMFNFCSLYPHIVFYKFYFKISTSGLLLFLFCFNIFSVFANCLFCSWLFTLPPHHAHKLCNGIVWITYIDFSLQIIILVKPPECYVKAFWTLNQKSSKPGGITSFSQKLKNFCLSWILI